MSKLIADPRSKMVATITEKQLEPPLKWPGGKRDMVPLISEYWLAHKDIPEGERVLHEPFVGAGSVALGLRPQHAILCDLNWQVINFFNQVKSGLTLEDIDTTYSSEVYYKNRDRLNQLCQDGQSLTREAAALFYYINRTGYNGLVRSSKEKRGSNVPVGRHKKVQILNDFSPWQQAIAEWEFYFADFELSLRMAPMEAFVYADPPYDDGFTGYTGESFSWNQQCKLAHLLSDHPGPVLASNAATDRIVELYEKLGFEIRFIEVGRSISCTGDRAKAKEILAFKAPVGG